MNEEKENDIIKTFQWIGRFIAIQAILNIVIVWSVLTNGK